MGMFDYLCIDNKWIPEDKQMPYDEQDYQTKSLDCQLNLYEILEDGRLLLTKKFWGDEETDVEMITPTEYTGEIEFYSDHTFKAWCINGIVKEVVYIPESV